MKDDPALQVNGHAVTDGSEIYYYGISDGGIQGGTFMALSPRRHARRAQRARRRVEPDDDALARLPARSRPFLDSVYPDFARSAVLIAALQSYWDYTDPITFAPHVIANPLPPDTPPEAHPRAGGDQRRAGAEPGDAPARARARHSRHQPRGAGLRRRRAAGAARLGLHAVGRASDAGAARRQHAAADGQRRARGDSPPRSRSSSSCARSSSPTAR